MTPTSGRSWPARHPDAADIVISAAFAVVVAVGTIAQRGTGTDALLAAVSLGLGVGVAVLWSLRRRRDRVDREARALLEQRLSIARELHDVVAHHVSVIGIQAAAARRTIDRSPVETAAALTAIEASSRSAVLEMQRLVTTLRHPDETADTQDSGGTRSVPVAPAPALADFPDLCDRMEVAGLRIERVAVDAAALGGIAGLPASMQLALYRVAQEALTNALRHAGSVDVSVSLLPEGDWVTLAIVSGSPTSPRPAPTPGGGLGIPGMRERMGAVGGTLDASPTADGGFAVTARVPSGGNEGDA
jgi:signal transduction histidine kinase